MRPLVYLHTLNLLTPRGWLAGIFLLAFLVCLFSLASNTALEVHLSMFFTLIFMAAILPGSMLQLIASKPLSFCLPNQQRLLRPVVMLLGSASCIGITALTLKLMALNGDHALYAEFLSGPAFRQLLLQGLTLYFLVLSLLLAVTLIAALKRDAASTLLLLLILYLLLFGDIGSIKSPAIAAVSAALSAALCWWLLGLRSIARHACQTSSSGSGAWFQFSFWRGGRFESLILSGIRRFGSDTCRGAFLESLYALFSGTTTRNIALVLLACLYAIASALLSYQDTPNFVRLYDFFVIPLMPLCFPVFRIPTMFSPWLPVSRAQRFVRLLWQGLFHYLFALLLVVFIRATLSLMIWGFPDASWYDYAKNALDVPLKILFLCGLFALVANFFHAAIRSTLAAVICMVFIGVICFNTAPALVPAFFALDVIDIALLSLLVCVPFVLACAYYSFRADLRERKQAWLG